MTLCLSYLHGFRIRVDLSQDHLDLLRLQINNIIHNPLGQTYMLLEQIIIEISVRSERIYHI